MIGIGVGIGVNSYVAGGTVPLLLDTYSADVAYSLRKLRTAYTGNAIRIRRSNDNAETNIGFVGNNLDTAAINSFVGANSAFVTTWYSQGSATYSVTQSSATLQPRIVNAGVLETKNGLPAIRFDGSNDSLFNSSSTVLNITNMSYYSVSSNDVTGGNGCVFSQNYYSSNTVRIFCDRRTDKRNMVISNNAATNFFANMSIQRNTSDIRLLSSYINGSNNMSCFDNGATGSTDTYTGTVYNDGIILGSQFSATYLNGTIQEFIAYTKNNSSDRTTIESNINTYYSIY